MGLMLCDSGLLTEAHSHLHMPDECVELSQKDFRGFLD